MQYRIRSAIANEVVTHQGEFTTPDLCLGDPRTYPHDQPLAVHCGESGRRAMQSSSFDDSAWKQEMGCSGSTSVLGEPNVLVQPKGELLPLDPSTGFPFSTYYFSFPIPLHWRPGERELHFTNYIDDGAILYLNGIEIWRNHLPLGVAIQNKTLADGYNCGGDATCTVDFCWRKVA